MLATNLLLIALSGLCLYLALAPFERTLAEIRSTWR
jgi:hypothetical protein